MRHRKHKSKLGRPTGHRYALLKNLANALLNHERILTTIAKAKELRKYVEPLITLAKKANGEKKGEAMVARRKAFARLQDKKMVKKLFDDIGLRYVAREKKLEEAKRFGKGGYTRIVRVGPRLGDAAETAFIELVERIEKEVKKPAKKKRELPVRPQI